MPLQLPADVLETLILVFTRSQVGWRTADIKLLLAQGLIICNFKDSWIVSEKSKTFLKEVEELADRLDLSYKNPRLDFVDSKVEA